MYMSTVALASNNKHKPNWHQRSDRRGVMNNNCAPDEHLGKCNPFLNARRNRVKMFFCACINKNNNNNNKGVKKRNDDCALLNTDNG